MTEENTPNARQPSEEKCVALTSSYRLFQPSRGHRYSVDDMLVAYVACTIACEQVSREPKRVLDLGCGLASVMLMIAWRFPHAKLVGVEAQPEHVALARRNILLNRCDERASIIEGDLRLVDLSESPDVAEAPFDLITATPPYFDPKASTVCSNTQRAYAQWELRGGIEEYAKAAAKVLSSDGRFVTCSSWKPEGRALRAFEQADLKPVWRCDVEPRPNAEPFLSLWVVIRSSPNEPAVIEHPRLLLRNSDGTRTPAHIQIREWFGIRCGLR